MSIRGEIKRLYYDVGDTFGGNALNAILSDVLEHGADKEWRQGLLDSYASYAKTDPALMGVIHSVAAGLVLADPRIAAEAPEIPPTGAAELPERSPAPSPARGGRLGSPATRAQNAEIAADLKEEGFIITGGGGEAPEEYIRGAGPGTRGSIFVDITAINKETGAVTRVQTIDTLADGSPTPREAATAARIRAAYPNDTLILVPKRSAR
jgi:pyruvate/2-oxoglutarate dehydrogenase complex dihydrolipoamide acyltransferase (E2) component